MSLSEEELERFSALHKTYLAFPLDMLQLTVLRLRKYFFHKFLLRLVQ